MEKDVDALIAKLRDAVLGTYRLDAGRIREDFGIEETVVAGGYGYRQVLELVQNGADAIIEARDSKAATSDEGRIEVVLTKDFLYVANTGAALSAEGVDALVHSHSSPKRGNQIGRFGLGFKSLLCLGGLVDVFSASSSIRFDPKRCRDIIRHEFGLSEADDVPALRLAWTINRQDEQEADDVLNSMRWATTVVRAELAKPTVIAHLQSEIREFPAPFLLFLSVKVNVKLTDGAGLIRQISRRPEGKDILLNEGDVSSRWRLVESEIRIDDADARADATGVHFRESVPIAWAVPMDASRDEAGRFWAFFPTDTPTRLPGILNAPWKLNSDRRAIIEGAWNIALMREAAILIAGALSSLAEVEDPGRPVDAFPRELDRPGEVAAPLIEALWARIEAGALVADVSGQLRLPNKLWRPPVDAKNRDNNWYEHWSNLVPTQDRDQWIHPSCLRALRGSRIDALSRRMAKQQNQGPLAAASLRRASAKALFDVIASPDLVRSKAVLRVVASFAMEREGYLWGTERQLLAIVPATDGKLRSPAQLFIGPGNAGLPKRDAVHDGLASDAECRAILIEALGIKELDEKGWRELLNELLRIATTPAYPPARKNGVAWAHIWTALHATPSEIAQRFVETNDTKLRVRRRDGAWVLRDEVLVPGRIVAANDPLEGNRNILLDDSFHSDAGLPAQMNIGDRPFGLVDSLAYDKAVGEHDSLLRDWLKGRVRDYRSQLDNAKNPQSNLLRPLGLALPAGWALLSQLDGAANTCLTCDLLRISKGLARDVSFGHETVATYPKVQFDHPFWWFVAKHGCLPVGGKAVSLRSLLARHDLRWVQQLAEWAELVALVCPLLVRNSPPVTLNELTELWFALTAHFVTADTVTKADFGDFWTAAARDGFVPKTLPSQSSDVPIDRVYVTDSAGLAAIANKLGRLAIALEPATRSLWLKAGARLLDELLRPRWGAESGSPVGLTTALPELAVEGVLRTDLFPEPYCRTVTDLALDMEGQSQAAPCLQWQGALLLDAKQLSSMPRTQRFAAILAELATAGWLQGSADTALRMVADALVEAQRAKVAAGGDLAQRLLLAVGGQTQPLRDVLGEAACKALSAEIAPHQLAELVLAMLGPSVLPRLGDSLRGEGLDPPRRWGSDEARAFVAAIDFPDAYAAATETKPDAEEWISGPIPLPPLHDFQVEVIEGIKRLIESGTGRRRTVVSLPTGGGKTRVTVQAAVELVLKPEGPQRSVLWVAQTDELCEQAVQCFRQVWVNLGTRAAPLRIVRLWGGHPNPSPSPDGEPIALIANILTLASRIGADGLAWPSTPGLVVIDECHHAITKSYTGLLRWIAPEPGLAAKPEPPIIGLSATPFRGQNSDDENERLARRFDKRWLPSGQDDLYRALQAQGILAAVDHEALKSTASLLDDEIERLSRLEGDSENILLENLLDEINRRLAGNQVRNRMLIDTIKSSCEAQILFFANSVNHASEMAARLNLEGIASAAINGDTPKSARRYFLDRFQRGELRVLCNHSVLTTGFDAPKTDMVLIARQVLSPVRYMQMVGRGLRGTKNGGTERCRIVTVIDNLGRFANRHPYQLCAKYFTRGA